MLKSQVSLPRVAMGNTPFSDLPFFLVVKNPYDPRSQILFGILSKKRTHFSYIFCQISLSYCA